MLNKKSDNIEVPGRYGTWYVIDTTMEDGQLIFILESEEYGTDAGWIEVNQSGIETQNSKDNTP